MRADQRALYDRIVGGPRGQRFPELVAPDGSLRGPFNPLLLQPAIGAALQDLGRVVRFEGSLSDAVREAVILTVARALPCGYEWRVHRPLAEAAGLDPDQLDEALCDRASALPSDVRAAVRACQELAVHRTLSDEIYAATIAELGDDGVLELIAVVGYYWTLGMIINVFGAIE